MLDHARAGRGSAIRSEFRQLPEVLQLRHCLGAHVDRPLADDFDGLAAELANVGVGSATSLEARRGTSSHRRHGVVDAAGAHA